MQKDQYNLLHKINLKMKKLFISLATISAIILSGCCGNKEKEETEEYSRVDPVESEVHKMMLDTKNVQK